jgi:hypothetical protein
VKTRAVLALVVFAGLGAAIWALSIPVTGKSEPCDADSLYYFVALAVAGVVSGAVVPKPLWAHYLGAVLG